VIEKLLDLLRRCESGHESRFPQCPICGEKWFTDGQFVGLEKEGNVWFDGSKQPHTKDCELGIVIDPAWLTTTRITFSALETRVEELESMLEDATSMHPLHCDCDACKFASARGVKKQS